MSRIQTFLTQMTFARTYTIRLIDTIDQSEWFRMPTEGVSHVAWQVAHLAMAEYRLCLHRDSVANSDPAQNPTPAEIRSIFDQVHQQMLSEYATMSESFLDEPLFAPHSLCKTKAEILTWCSHHEMLHAGQIGLLRRLFGNQPMW